MKTRNAVLDFIELLGEQAALLDHVKEGEINLESEKEAVLEGKQDPENIYALTLDIDGEIAENRGEQTRLLNQRRELQQIFFDLYHIEPEEWCKVKHYATVLTLIGECANAHPESEGLHRLEKEIRRSIYSYFGTILGVGPADCGRCLTDMLDGEEGEVGGEA